MLALALHVGAIVVVTLVARALLPEATLARIRRMTDRDTMAIILFLLIFGGAIAAVIAVVLAPWLEH